MHSRRFLLSRIRYRDRSGSLLSVNLGDDSTGAPGAAETSNPWQERKDRGLAAALFASLGLLATAPRRFFAETRVGARVWGPLLFAGLVSALSVLLNVLIFAILAVTLPEPALDLVDRMEVWGSPFDYGSAPDGTALPNTLRVFVGLQATLLLLPVIFLVSLAGVLITAGVGHVLLVLTRTSRPHGFRGTLTAACYANSAALLAALPLAGDILSGLGTAVLFALGLYVLQGATAVRAAVVAAILALLALSPLLFLRAFDTQLT